MSTIKRTVINADEELVIKGKLTIEGNVTQLEQTNVITVTNLAGNTFTINSVDPANPAVSNTTAILSLNSYNTQANLSYSNTTGKLVISVPLELAANSNIETTGNVVAGWFRGDGSNITGLSTTIVSEGANLYFNNARVRAAITHVDAGGDGSFVYDGANGIFTYTGPSASETRAHFSATDGLAYNSTTGVFTLDSNAAGNGLIYSNGVIHVGAGDGITVGLNNVAVDSTVVRTSGDQDIYGVKTFENSIILAANINLLPETNNTSSIGNSTNWIKEVYSNVIHIHSLNIGPDANLEDLHNTFYPGTAANAVTTRTAGGLTYSHNATGAYYAVNAGDGLQISSNNVAVDNTVVRTTGTQNIDGAKTFLKDVAVQGNLDVTGNINSRDQVDLYVTDTKITLANGSLSNVDAYIYVDGNYTNNPFIKWDQASSSWKFSNDGTTTISIPTSTTDLAEGNNLYFTTGRVNTAIDAYIIGGNGLTYSSGNISVGAGSGITVNADNVAVDSSVVRTTGNQTISGIKNFTGELVVPTGVPTSNNSIYVNAGNSAVFAYVNGVHVQLTADSDVGQVEDVGNTGINIYAGFRQDLVTPNSNVVYHGIKSIDTGTYLTISEASNVITMSGNITAIRNGFSVSNLSGFGNLSYNNTTGVISYTGISNSDVRGLFTGTGLINVNSSTGVISTTADNYSSWSVQTDSGPGAKTAINSGHTLTITGTNGVTVTNTGNAVSIAGLSADITAVTAGNGLTGGGNSGDVTLNVAAGDGITVNADNVAVDSTVVRTSGSQTINGDKTLTGNTNIGSYNTTNEFTGRFKFNRSGVGFGDAIAPNGDVIWLTDGYNDNDACEIVFFKSRPTSSPNLGDAIGGINFKDGYAGNNCLSLISYYSSSGKANLVISNNNLSNTIIEFTQDSKVKIANSYTLPITDGTNGQKLTTYGNGTVYWSTETGDIESVAAGNGLIGGGTSGTVTLDIGAGTGITVNADNVAVNMSAFSTTNLAEGTNLYFTNARANTAMDAYLVGGNGLTYSSGTFAVGAGTGITVNADNVALTSGVITAGTYGTASAVPAITVDTYGRVTNIANTNISITASQVSNFTSAANTAIDARVSGGNGLTYSSGVIAVGAGNYITVATDTVSVDATSTNTANKVVARDADGNFAANVITATATSARYADLAENYQGDADYLPGTVLVFGGEAEVTAVRTYESTRIAGVVTTQPAHVMNSDLTGPTVACIALRGRVPVKVKGVVRKGDVLISAGEGLVGYAIASLEPRSVPAAAIVGKAITDKLDADLGIVEVLI